MESWQRIDDKHSHCGNCSGIFRNAQLHNGLCGECGGEAAEKEEKVLSRSTERTHSRAMKASAQLLASIRAQGKTGKSMPVVMDAFIKGIGGEAAYGEAILRDFRRAQGEGLSGAELETFEYSPNVVLKWYELINRSLLATDSGKDLDVGSLEDSDLESILASLGRKHVLEDKDIRRLALMNAIEDDAEFRRTAFDLIIKHDPQIETEWLAKHGIATIEPAKKHEASPNKSIEDELHE